MDCSALHCIVLTVASAAHSFDPNNVYLFQEL